MSELNAFLDGTFVGVFRQSASGSLMFRYDDEYRARADATPVSLSMPLVLRDHRNKPVRAFLSGLLPDSPGRLDELARTHRVSASNPFALLRFVGRDAAGAIQLLPPGEDSPDAAQRRGDISVLPPNRFAEIIADVVANADTWGRRETGGHWSLPGAQPKLALFKTADGHWAVPNDSTPTTHILKPAVAPFTQHHINEFVTMEAARRLTLRVAEDTMVRTSLGDHVLVSERYDRQLVAGRWRRRHQEDLCQSLAVPPQKEYQRDGGPGIGAVAQLFGRLQTLADRELTSRRFFEAIVFNATALGTDAHAKNYSLLLTGDRAELAPLYDLATHAPYPTRNGRPLEAAMSVSSQYRLDAISVDQLVAEGRRLGVDPDLARATVERMRADVAPAFHEAARLASIELPDESGFALETATAIERHAAGHGWI